MKRYSLSMKNKNASASTFNALQGFQILLDVVPRIIVVLFGSALVLLLTACGFWAPSVPGPVAPCSVVSSKQAADRLLQRIDAATKTRGQSITITATSQELTSLLNEFVTQAKQLDPSSSVPLDNPTVCFKSGKMTLYGKINTMGVNSSGLISVAAAVKDGRASFRVEQVELGPLSVPAGLGDVVSSLISTALNQNLSQVQLTRVEIQGDQIVMSGRVR
jgi:hypothetical protein